MKRPHAHFVRPAGAVGGASARRTVAADSSPPYIYTRRVLAVLAAVVIAITLVSCMRAPETALRIGTNVWIGSEPLYLARELGQLDPAQVQRTYLGRMREKQAW